MTKKDLKTKLSEIGYNCMDGNPGEIYVWNGGSYVTTLNIKDGKLIWNGENHTKTPIDCLMQKVEEYNKTLEFDANTYCPAYSKESVTDLRIDSTLTKCGFTDINWFGNKLSGVSNGELGAKFTKFYGNQLITGNYSFIKMYEDDSSDSLKCSTIKSFMAAFYATQIAKMAATLADMGKVTDSLKSIPITTVNPNTFEVTTKEGVDGIIALLENTLKRLKN